MVGFGLDPADILRVILFVGAVCLVFYLAFRWLYDRARGKPPRSRFDRCFRTRWAGAVVLGTALAGIACVLYGIFVEPTRLAVASYTIESAKIPAGQRIRLVHLGDLHVRAEGPRERALPELIRSLHPDLILHTGDFFARSGVEPTVERLLGSWDVPQFACEGNLDDLADFDGTMKAGGVTVLNGSPIATCTIRGMRLSLAGFMSGAQAPIHKTLKSLPPDTFNIVLYHHPQGFPETWDTPADLMLAGHTHGGQICLPFYGALLTFDKYGKRWESGHYTDHGVHLVVTRGVGCEPFAPEMRFCCRPQVVVIDLVGTGKTP